MATQAVHALPFRHCDTADLFTVTKDDNGEGAAIIAASNDYLKAFVAPVKDKDGKPACFHCGERIDAMMAAFGVATAIEWTLAHGEGRCIKCRWPYRGMHFPKDAEGEDLWTARNLFLAYHPDEVSEEEKAA